jgi:hypothetical protein
VQKKIRPAGQLASGGASLPARANRAERLYVVRRDKTGMLLGMKESYKKGESESILALSLAAGIVRGQSKRRQGYRWAGLLSFEKRLNRMLTL